MLSVKLIKFISNPKEISSLSSSVFFPAELFLSNLSIKNDSREVQRHAPPKNFENLRTAKTILVLFEQFLRKVCPIFGP